ncbi:hypothetical protein GALL_312170 [mine drainage metagenome]|uniref:Uncharacterized protein n=1 Tax=mine drainage metagenome TaxID=410659 RepID=A0A1J5QTH2_9ZZZZ
MRQTRRQFIQQSLLTLPAISALASCGGGGGGGSAAASGTSSTGSTANPNPGATTTSPVSNTLPPQTNIDLSAGLTNVGKAFMPYSPLVKQPVLQRFKDPDFGTTMLRITDIANGLSGGQYKANVAMPAYPTTQAWNCNETRLILYVTTSPFNSGDTQGWAMFDGKTYQFITMLNINPSDIEQFWWSLTDPTLLYYISNYSLGSTVHAELTVINVETGATSIVHDFIPDLKALGWPTAGPVRAGYPLANGGNNVIWGLGAGGIPNVNTQLGLNVFGFNMQTGKLTQYPGVAQQQARGATPFPRLSGNGWVWNYNTASNQANYQAWVLDINGNVTLKVNFSADEHLDTGLNAAGQDLLVGPQYSTAVLGNMIMANLATGAVTPIIGIDNGYGYPRNGSFAGATAYYNRPWVVGAAVGSPYGTASDLSSNNGAVSNPQTMIDQEIYIANVNTGAVLRVAHHRSTGYYSNSSNANYWAQTNVTISPSGTRILFQSDWGDANPAKPVINPNAVVDTYVLELPTYTG